jgi:hypothetical protein
MRKITTMKFLEVPFTDGRLAQENHWHFVEAVK